MKQAKQRVIAIDYFRGVCILAVVMNHSMAFSMPFAYITGASGLWTSAAEIFLLLSGLTLGIVRGESITSNFWQMVKKMWRRAAGIYLLNILVVSISLLMAVYFTSHGLNNNVLGSLPVNTSLSLLWSILNLSYGVGWASFLALYAIYMIFAPFILYSLRTKYWLAAPVVSLGIFCINFVNPQLFGYASNFALWQLYFVVGLALARFRVPVIGFLYGLKNRSFNLLTKTIYGLSALFLAVNILLNFNISPTVARLAEAGWLPVKLQAAYIALLDHRTTLDIIFMNSRTGILRPMITLLFLATTYLIYQKHKNFLLSRTGYFVNTLGRDTLWVFVAQALTIPALSALRVPRNLAMNFILTSTLIMLMWAVARRRAIWIYAQAYSRELKASYSQAKYAYLQRYEENN